MNKYSICFRFDLELLKYGVERTNIMYGGKDPKVTRVVLVNGSIDPWHYLGVTKQSNPDIPVIFINGEYFIITIIII